MWIMVDEAHIINIAVRETCRGQGIGELLLISSIDMATRLKASVVTLEVQSFQYGSSEPLYQIRI